MSEFNLDSLLDGSLDDLADAPEFTPLPAGTHRATVTLAPKEVNGKAAYELNLSILETLELAKPEDTPPTVGTKASVLYMLGNEYGQGAFKKILIAFSKHFGSMSNRDLIEVAQHTEVLVVTKQRPNKDKTLTYCEIVELHVV